MPYTVEEIIKLSQPGSPFYLPHHLILNNLNQRSLSHAEIISTFKKQDPTISLDQIETTIDSLTKAGLIKETAGTYQICPENLKGYHFATESKAIMTIEDMIAEKLKSIRSHPIPMEKAPVLTHIIHEIDRELAPLLGKKAYQGISTFAGQRNTYSHLPGYLFDFEGNNPWRTYIRCPETLIHVNAFLATHHTSFVKAQPTSPYDPNAQKNIPQLVDRPPNLVEGEKSLANAAHSTSGSPDPDGSQNKFNGQKSHVNFPKVDAPGAEKQSLPLTTPQDSTPSKKSISDAQSSTNQTAGTTKTYGLADLLRKTARWDVPAAGIFQQMAYLVLETIISSPFITPEAWQNIVKSLEANNIIIPDHLKNKPSLTVTEHGPTSVLETPSPKHIPSGSITSSELSKIIYEQFGSCRKTNMAEVRRTLLAQGISFEGTGDKTPHTITPQQFIEAFYQEGFRSTFSSVNFDAFMWDLTFGRDGVWSTDRMERFCNYTLHTDVFNLRHAIIEVVYNQSILAQDLTSVLSKTYNKQLNGHIVHTAAKDLGIYQLGGKLKLPPDILQKIANKKFKIRNLKHFISPAEFYYATSQLNPEANLKPQPISIDVDKFYKEKGVTLNPTQASEIAQKVNEIKPEQIKNYLNDKKQAIASISPSKETTRKINKEGTKEKPTSGNPSGKGNDHSRSNSVALDTNHKSLISQRTSNVAVSLNDPLAKLLGKANKLIEAFFGPKAMGAFDEAVDKVFTWGEELWAREKKTASGFVQGSKKLGVSLADALDKSFRISVSVPLRSAYWLAVKVPVAVTASYKVIGKPMGLTVAFKDAVEALFLAKHKQYKAAAYHAGIAFVFMAGFDPRSWSLASKVALNTFKAPVVSSIFAGVGSVIKTFVRVGGGVLVAHSFGTYGAETADKLADIGIDLRHIPVVSKVFGGIYQVVNVVIATPINEFGTYAGVWNPALTASSNPEALLKRFQGWQYETSAALSLWQRGVEAVASGLMDDQESYDHYKALAKKAASDVFLPQLKNQSEITLYTSAFTKEGWDVMPLKMSAQILHQNQLSLDKVILVEKVNDDTYTLSHGMSPMEWDKDGYGKRIKSAVYTDKAGFAHIINTNPDSIFVGSAYIGPNPEVGKPWSRFLSGETRSVKDYVAEEFKKFQHEMKITSNPYVDFDLRKIDQWDAHGYYHQRLSSDQKRYLRSRAEALPKEEEPQIIKTYHSYFKDKPLWAQVKPEDKTFIPIKVQHAFKLANDNSTQAYLIVEQKHPISAYTKSNLVSSKKGPQQQFYSLQPIQGHVRITDLTYEGLRKFIKDHPKAELYVPAGVHTYGFLYSPMLSVQSRPGYGFTGNEIKTMHDLIQHYGINQVLFAHQDPQTKKYLLLTLSGRMMAEAINPQLLNSKAAKLKRNYHVCISYGMEEAMLKQVNHVILEVENKKPKLLHIASALTEDPVYHLKIDKDRRVNLIDPENKPILTKASWSQLMATIPSLGTHYRVLITDNNQVDHQMALKSLFLKVQDNILGTYTKKRPLFSSPQSKVILEDQDNPNLSYSLMDMDNYRLNLGVVLNIDELDTLYKATVMHQPVILGYGVKNVDLLVPSSKKSFLTPVHKVMAAVSGR